MNESAETIVARLTTVFQSKKYRGLNIPPDTLRDLVLHELPKHKSARDVEDAVREKLHNIVAPYLGDPDFEAAKTDLSAAFAAQDPAAVQKVCRDILAAHASTRERLPILDGFYPHLFEVTGTPQTLLDLACGLNPFAFPWMGLPTSTRYYACDLNQPRVDLINHYFRLQGLPELAAHEDILVNPPSVEADVALVFKEAHRMEQRQKGCNRPFWEALNVRWLLVSLPTESLTGRHNLLEKHRRLVYSAIEGLSWPVTEVLFDSEIVFCIRKKE